MITAEYIEKAISVHGNRYDYSKTKYVNARTKICITCPEHGDFMQLPNSHLNGQGCPKCAGKGMDKMLFIEKAKKTHGSKYDYTRVEYIDSKTKVCIICPEHGEFWQAPSKHLYGRGCPKCAIENRTQKIRVSYEEFLRKVIGIHGDKYEYLEIEKLRSMHDKLRIFCKKHGEFQQVAYDHLAGHGCPKCGNIESNAEKEIYEYVCQLIGADNVIRKDRNILNGKEIDIFIPSLNIGIEYNGLRWHSEDFNKDEYYHLMKTNKCYEKKIKLIQIFEDEYMGHKEVVLEKIKHVLGKSDDKKRIYGRKCGIVEVNNEVAKEFLNKFHIQGYGKSSVCLSALYNGKVIAVMTFKKMGKNEWELTRFASDYNYVCCGVGGRLFKYFVQKYNPEFVKSFADRRWTIDDGDNFYTKLEFELDGILTPDYRYVYSKNPKERIHKFNFRKQTLHRKYGLPLTMTESKMAKELGYSKVWDCGLYRYVWKSKG